MVPLITRKSLIENGRGSVLSTYCAVTASPSDTLSFPFFEDASCVNATTPSKIPEDSFVS